MVNLTNFDSFNKIVLSCLQILEDTGTAALKANPEVAKSALEVKNFARRELAKLSPAQKRSTLKACGEILSQKGPADVGRAAGVIAGIAILVYVLDNFPMVAAFSDTYRNEEVPSAIRKVTGMSRDEFSRVFDAWDEKVGGFQRVRAASITKSA